MDRFSRVAVVVSVLALALSVFVWVDARRQIAQLRESQRGLLADLAALQRTPVIDVSTSPALGSDEAIVTLIEYSDYECPFCIRHFQQTWPELKSEYVDTGKVRYVFKDFPVDQLHPAAFKAHEAAHCGRDQNKYWEMHARLFSKPGTHAPEQLEQIASELGLNLETYRACVEAGTHTAAIKKSVAEATELGASGTPAFFFGLRDPATEQVRIFQAVTGAQPFETFVRAIEAVARRQQR
jgi:protein-disulfide isomerase